MHKFLAIYVLPKYSIFHRTLYSINMYDPDSMNISSHILYLVDKRFNI